PELLHADSGNVDHRQNPERPTGRASRLAQKTGILSKGSVLSSRLGGRRRAGRRFRGSHRPPPGHYTVSKQNGTEHRGAENQVGDASPPERQFPVDDPRRVSIDQFNVYP